MPLTLFICPDKETVPVETCLKKCRLHMRCCPIAFCEGAADERIWTGVPSVTQLLRGTRESWLRIKKDFATIPQSRAWALLGTAAHTRLEDAKDTIIYEGISMTPDAIEEWNGQHVLIDYKTSGSYYVAKLFGIIQDDTLDGFSDVPKKKGPKTFRVEPMAVEKTDYELQLNMYRIGIEHVKGIPISKMINFILVRDGDTYIAKSRGIYDKTYTLIHDRLDDMKVLAYFMGKKDALLHHLMVDEVPPICSSHENWEWRKCANYCDVSSYCNWETVKEERI